MVTHQTKGVEEEIDRLTVKPDNTVKVEIDKEEIYSGSMKEDWELLKPKEISDPEDKKPSDWADDAMMDDPEDKKPDDWVTEQRVVDSSAKKPDDWDDEEDGDWEAPMIDNPDYKGDWYVKRISNPAYKGVWEPKKIANPEYEDDNEVGRRQPQDQAPKAFEGVRRVVLPIVVVARLDERSGSWSYSCYPSCGGVQVRRLRLYWLRPLAGHQ